ncbi:MAG: 30S ribosomal protein S8 [Nanoarchaeota archaeon]
MVLNDSIADAFSKINNAVKALNKKVTLRNSKLLRNLLKVLHENGYIGSFEIKEDGRQGLIEVNLLGTINECGVIKPRYPVKFTDLESFEKKFLPAKDFGILILTTNKGILTQKKAKEEHIGGSLVAYCY